MKINTTVEAEFKINESQKNLQSSKRILICSSIVFAFCLGFCIWEHLQGSVTILLLSLFVFCVMICVACLFLINIFLNAMQDSREDILHYNEILNDLTETQK
jgi:hypothetical protein